MEILMSLRQPGLSVAREDKHISGTANRKSDAVRDMFCAVVSSNHFPE
jgi:hypothetical protein